MQTMSHDYELLACRLGNSDMPNTLEIYIISCGSSLNFNCKNKAGHSPLEMAANSAFSSCLTLLKKHSNKADDAGSLDNVEVSHSTVFDLQKAHASGPN